MALPNGFWPVVQTFGVDQYRVVRQNPYLEAWYPYFPNDDVNNSNWPVFIEAAVLPKNQVPRGAFPATGDLLDIWPRKVVYYGGPVSRYYAPQYRKLIEDWAKGQGLAISTDIIPVQPNSIAAGMRHPASDFRWYIAYNEQRPQKRYRYVRKYGGNNFAWVDYSYDNWKYKNFKRANPTVT